VEKNSRKSKSPSLLEQAHKENPVNMPKRESMDVTECSGEMAITYFGEKIETPEQLIANAHIDLRIWEVSKVTVNNWGVGGKLRQGQDASGKWQSEKLWQQALRQIKVELRRRAPKYIQDAIKELLSEWKPSKLPSPKRRKINAEPHMLELALHDAHFGKRCWKAQTGKDFDLDIIASDYTHAIDELFDRARHYNIEKVIAPIGSDFFQVNNWMGTTAHGTQVDSTDDRFPKVFKAGLRAMEYAIKKAREVADVEFFYLGGNHDMETSWYLSQTLGEIFRDDPHVTIDDSPRLRKYISYGPALIGFAHGDEIKLDKLPLLMATEASEAWASSRHRHWHTGHLHKKGMLKYTAGDTHNGVEVWILPSLSGTDLWHFKHGFVGNVRAAEAYLWSKSEGYAGHFSVSAKS